MVFRTLGCFDSFSFLSRGFSFTASIIRIVPTASFMTYSAKPLLWLGATFSSVQSHHASVPYQITRKPVHLESSCTMRTNVQ